MKKQILFSLSLAATVSLAACTVIPKEAYYNRGQPEALLSVSSEQVNIDLRQRNGLQQLTQAVNNNQPSDAELSCTNKMICDRAIEILRQYNVPFKQVGSTTNQVTLNYSTITARDCENRYIDNHTNPYNLNHPTFGCSMALNQVQMVSDKRQFVDPLLLGGYDGEKATQNYDTYLSRTPVMLDTVNNLSNTTTR